MRRIAWVLAVGLLASLFVAVPAGSASAAPAEAPSLWLTDDETGMVYNVTLDGDLISQFEVPGTRRAESSIAVDPIDRTLWGTNDGAGSPRLVHYDRKGNVIAEIPSSTFGGAGTEGIDVTVSVDNQTLWVVDDILDTTTGRVPTVYNVTRTGTLISSFPTSKFDAAATSPQAIAYDPFTSTLWLTDNDANEVYNVSLQGKLLSSFAVDTAAFGMIDNPQGISVESLDVLWITARDTSRIYRVTKAGDQIISSFPIAGVDPIAEDPTGVAFDRPPGYLGAAASFGILGLAGSELKMKDAKELTGAVGDVGIGPDSKQDFDDGFITGALIVDPTADNSNNHDVVIADGVTAADLSVATADAAFASLAASILPPTQEFGEIKNTIEITGAPGLNVIEADKIELDNAEQMTLTGDASSVFVFNVAEKLKFKDRSSVRLAGSVSGENVFFNLLGTDDSAIESGSFVTGTIVAPHAKLKIKGQGSLLVGAMIGGREIKLEDGGRLRAPALALAPGDLGEATAAALLGLPDSKVKLADSGSTVIGDVVLGPLAEQDFSKGRIDGVLVVDPDADNSHSNSVQITGGTVVASVQRAAADAVDASTLAAGLPADQVLDEITKDTTIEGGPGVVVVHAKKIELDGHEELTLVGDASTVFIFNLDEKIKLKNGSSVVAGGDVLPQNVLFNVLGGTDSSIESGSSALGTILAPWAGKVKVKDAKSILVGSVIGGGELVVEKGAVVENAS